MCEHLDAVIVPGTTEGENPGEDVRVRVCVSLRVCIYAELNTGSLWLAA